MFKIRRLFGLLIACMLAPSLALAQDLSQPTAKVHYFRLETNLTNKYNLLQSAPLNGAAATLLVTLDVGSLVGGNWDGYSYGTLKVKVAYVRGAGTATHVNTVVSCSHDGATTYATKTTRSCTSGSCKVFLMTDKNQVDGLTDDEDASAGNETWEQEYSVLGELLCKVQLSGTSAAAADLVSLQASMSVGG
jgi:hypothetical protein